MKSDRDLENLHTHQAKYYNQSWNETYMPYDIPVASIDRLSLNYKLLLTETKSELLQ